mmetsp:Transcript_25359/g.27712  ORF Transcript_25359/g.27712 Transcript_25359/m.27712 type:complete len:459 (-) Transcript_25359:542-1918(-)|eukprot:CAMPEP_0173151822 /NCGR_PEP_ID=MMETSP1105-20130129/11829_1 /TAXON_ID=2985 /ORGANISM="Ochromonas sp., Strain BG-1" /LENGTH=458 /DNA_ID=CAMNT_0014067311 /DNA_START=612 /DNA_END=1988 /DNA_ORIENTATION=-
MEPMEVSGKSSSATTSASTSSKTLTTSLSSNTSTSDIIATEAGKKRKKLTSDERLNRNRERNRIHARKTRERKKFQTSAIQNRIHQLFEEGQKLRQMIDERYTASSLLGLSQSPNTKRENDQNKVALVPSSTICNNFYENIITENNWIKDTNGNPYFQPVQTAKRVRRSGKLNPQEREKIRRERNRMHAKKTRDRKKFFLEMSDKIISEMETESKALRDYLRTIGVLSEEEYQQRTLIDLKAREEIDNLKLSEMDEGVSEAEDEDEEEEDEDNGETASENENNEREERSPSGSSDENEKVSWSRSSASSNPDSSGAQSMDFASSNKSHSSSNTDTAKLSSGSNFTTNDGKSSNGSSDSYREKRSDNSGSDERDSPNYNQTGMIINDNDWNEGDEYRERDDPSSDRSSEAPESYHHGRKGKTVKVVDPSSSTSNSNQLKDNKNVSSLLKRGSNDSSGIE